MTDSPHVDIAKSHGRLLCDPEWRDWLDQRGYLSGAPTPSPAREVFFRSARRENARRDDGLGGIRVYDKLLHGKKDADSAFREWGMLTRAAAAGINVARPLCASAVRIEGRPTAMLATANLPGRSLADMLRDVPADPGALRDLAQSVGRAIAALHAADITFPSLFAKHVLVDDDGKIGFLDLADARSRPLRPIDRARDLGALGATLPRWPVSRGLRMIALRAYLDAAKTSWSLKDAWRDIACAVNRRMRRRRYRIHLAGTPVSPRTPLAPEDNTRIIVEERNALERFGGLQALEVEGAPRVLDGDLVVVRATRDRTLRAWSILELLHAFDIPAPHAVAMRFDSDHGALLRRDRMPPPRNPILDERLLDVFSRTLRAGLAPKATLAGALFLDDENAIHILEPEFDQPAVVHLRRQLRRFRTLVGAFVRRGMDASSARDLYRELSNR